MKTLKKFDFGTAGARSTHDWETILAGGIVQLDSGTDFECKDATMSSLIRNQARKQGKTVKVRNVEGGLVVQAEEASKEQKAEWAKADAAKKKAKATAKAGGNGDADDSDDDEADEDE